MAAGIVLSYLTLRQRQQPAEITAAGTGGQLAG
jgi:hypothetical protein